MKVPELCLQLRTSSFNKMLEGPIVHLASRAIVDVADVLDVLFF